MKKIILLLVCAIACVGMALGLNQTSDARDKKGDIVLENIDNKEIDKVSKEEEKIDKKDKIEEVEEKLEKKEANKEQKEEKKDTIKKEEGVQKPNKPVEDVQTETPKKKEVSISINAQKAINYGINKESGFGHLPANGVLLSEQKVEIKDGETVFDVLMKITKKNKLHMEYTGAGSAIYIEGIDNLYEFDCGKFSGWMYEVNGIYPNYGVGAYKVKDGDRITFNYTCDLGKDLGTPAN